MELIEGVCSAGSEAEHAFQAGERWEGTGLELVSTGRPRSDPCSNRAQVMSA